MARVLYILGVICFAIGFILALVGGPINPWLLLFLGLFLVHLPSAIPPTP